LYNVLRVMFGRNLVPDLAGTLNSGGCSWFYSVRSGTSDEST